MSNAPFIKLALLALKLALRDMRAGIKHFRFFLIILCFGVTLIALTQSMYISFAEGLSANGREILGGDLSFSLVQHEITPPAANWLSSLGEVSTQIDTRTMARPVGQNPILVELKIIDEHYPLAGALITQPAYTHADDKARIYVDSLFLIKSNTQIGDHVILGNEDFTIAGTLEKVPDALSSGLSFGVRALISRVAFERTGLHRAGALLKWTYKLKLHETDINALRLNTIIVQAQGLFPAAGWEIKSSFNAAPQLAKNIERISQFLILMSLCGFILGGLGIQQAIEAYLINKSDDFAIFKALGASPRAIVILASAQIGFFAVLTACCGGLIGTSLPFIIYPWLQALELPIYTTWSGHAFVIAMVSGICISFLFSLLPLARLRRRSVSELLRSVSSTTARPHLHDRLLFIFMSATIILFLYLTALDRQVTLYFLAGCLCFILILILCDKIIARLPVHIFSAISRSWYMAWSNITRMGDLRRAFMIACGFSFALMTLIGGVGASLKYQLSQQATDRIPRYFIIDVSPDTLPALLDFILHKSTMTAHAAPMLRGRVVLIRDEAVDKVKIDDNTRWVVEGDRGLTFADYLPEGSELTQGEWWPQNYNGEPLISMEEGAAKGMGLKINDYVTLNILGKNIRARIANLRKVNWQSLGINFVFVLSPHSFNALPFTYILTLNAPAQSVDDVTFVRDASNAFPEASFIRVREALDAIETSLNQINAALLWAMGLIFIAANLAVLASISTTYRLRLYEASIMRALGATRLQLARAIFIETSLLGFISLSLGLGFGFAGAYAFNLYVFGLGQLHINLAYIAIAVLLTLAMSIQTAIITLRKVLAHPPARSLTEN